jgi:antitoxin (DNA-binding transcriptional repressor) of toxin-antitoxin stability system
MPTVTVQEAQSQLSDLIHRLAPGDEVVITENGEPVAKLARTESEKQWPCKAGSAKGTIHWMAPDFDAPLEDPSPADLQHTRNSGRAEIRAIAVIGHIKLTQANDMMYDRQRQRRGCYFDHWFTAARSFALAGLCVNLR